MKVRTDYVTNSSSSSFIIVTKVNKCQELTDYMKEEYGKYGVGLLDKYLVKGVAEDEYGECYFGGHYIPESVAEELDPNTDYLVAEYITWTTDGDSNGDDAWLNDHIPDKFKEKIYESDSD